MATKRADELKRGAASYFAPGDAGDTGAAVSAMAEQPEHPKGPAALALYRRQGTPGELVAMAPDGQAWRVPDQADGWTARVQVELDDARGLTRLAPDAEGKALGRIGADVGQADPAPVSSRPAEPTPKGTPKGKAPRKVKAAAAADAPGSGAGRDAQVVCYVTAAEYAALVERAAADDRSVSYAARAAIRAYLGLE